MSSIVETNPDADADAAAVRDASQSQEYSIYEAIHDRYLYDDNDLNESLKNFTLLFNNSDKTESTRTNSTGESPRKLNSSNFFHYLSFFTIYSILFLRRLNI